MIRFMIDQVRQIPGPLKRTRLIAADLAEEILDLAEHYLERRRDPNARERDLAPDGEAAPPKAPASDAAPATEPDAGDAREPADGEGGEEAPGGDPPPPADEAPAAKVEDGGEAATAEDGDEAATAEDGPLSDVDERLAAAIDVPANPRKQEFKVLAILWDARGRERGPMSAKSISQHGKRLGLDIRHENVRKVIRTRLEKHVDIQTEGVGRGTIYRYEIADAGAAYFEEKYF